jgi:anti-sigma regulatory factor (Ser/Thr protein kinase)
VNAINGRWPLATPVMHTQPSSPDFRLLDSLPHYSTLEVEADETAPGEARSWLRNLLLEWSLAEFRDAAELVLSELVTNSGAEIGKVAWPAQRPRVRLCLRGGPSLVSVQVWDPILDPPVPREAADDEEGGRGLFLVRCCSASWGFYHAE